MSTDLAVRAGIHELPAEEYHADPLERPSLSASIAHLLCTSSPLHAWTAHPRLNPNYTPREEQQFDVGKAAHALLLEGANGIEVIDAPDWRTNAAKEAREAARAEGKYPLLAKHSDAVVAMVAAAVTQIEQLNVDPLPFTDGKPERTLIWREGDVLCRARCDWLRDDYATVDDLKSTSRSANPEAYSRALYGTGADVQAAMYLRGVEAITGVRPVFRWVVIETTPPYALSVVTPGPDVLALGEAKVEHALRIWRECLDTDQWPGYSTALHRAELPPYEEARWLAREEQAA